MRKPFVLLVLAYVVPTFLLGFVWHLVLFQSYYEALRIYRADIIIPFGFTSMLIQAGIFAWSYPRLVRSPGSMRSAVAFAAGAALLSWTFTTLAVGAKHPMTSVSGFFLIETAFTVVQFALVAPLYALASRTAVATPTRAPA